MAQTWTEQESCEFSARLCPKETDDNKELFLKPRLQANLPILFALSVSWSIPGLLLQEQRTHSLVICCGVSGQGLSPGFICHSV